MKKSIILCAIAIATIAAFQSCRKQEPPKPPIITNLNITLKQNEAYTFTLPANTTKSPYKFVTQASHYTISTVSKDASNNDIYQYTPSSNYTGTDNVTIADTKDGDCHNGNNPPPQGGCAHHHHHGNDNDDDDQQPNIVNINFTIGTSTSTTATLPAFSETSK